MNRYEFYGNLNKFKREQAIIHANTNKYYAKIDKYYSDGRARYFWSKDEWDAYQKEKKANADITSQNNLINGREAAERAAINKTVAEKQEKDKRIDEKLKMGFSDFTSKIEKIKPEIINALKNVLVELGTKYSQEKLTFEDVKDQIIQDIVDKINNENNDVLTKIKDIYDDVYGEIKEIYNDINDEQYLHLGGKMLIGVLFATIAGSSAYLDWATNFEKHGNAVQRELESMLSKFFEAGAKSKHESESDKFKKLDNSTGNIISKSVVSIAKLVDNLYN